MQKHFHVSSVAFIAAIVAACGPSNTSSSDQSVSVVAQAIEPPEPVASVPAGTPLPSKICPEGTSASLPNMTIECPFQTKATVAKDWEINPGCEAADGGWYFDCKAACTVTTGAAVNQPPLHFPYCAPGGALAPSYKSGCENVQPPQPSTQSNKNISRGFYDKDKQKCEDAWKKGCVANFGTAADRCKELYETEPTYVEGRQGVCCLPNDQPTMEAGTP